MNSKIVIGISAVIGFVAGGVAGYFFRKSQEVQFEECTEEELAEYARQQEEANQQDISEPQEVKVSEMISGESDSATTVDNRKIDYTKMWEQHNSTAKDIQEKINNSFASYGNPGDEEDVNPTDLDMDPEFAEQIATVSDEEDDPKVPELLTPDDIVPSSGLEFYGDETGWKKFTVFWYTKDDTMTYIPGDEDDFTHEEVVNDPVEEFGIDIENEFLKCRKDELEDMGPGHVLYRANPVKRIHYQIIQYPSSYASRMQQEEFGGNG